MHKLWKKFDQLSSKCYTELVQEGRDLNLWNETFSVLVEAIETGRSQNPDFAPELFDLEEELDYQFDVGCWMEDYLDELDIHEEYDKLREVCEKMLSLFQWKEDNPSDLRFLIASSMGAQGKNTEALAYCEDWYKSESDNINAATALVYAKMGIKDLAGAEKIVEQFLTKDTTCSDGNDIMFTAAADLYKANGNKEAEKRVTAALEKYEEELKNYFFGDE